MSVGGKRLDITAEVLGEPRFWAAELGTSLLANEFDDPAETCFGLAAGTVDEHYERCLVARWDAGITPFVRVELDGRQYLELELAWSAELQKRFWLGDEARGVRVMVGQHGGRPSLPAFRPVEVEALAARFRKRPSAPFALLLLGTCWLGDTSALDDILLASWLGRVPGLRRDAIADVQATVIAALSSSRARWRLHPELGWINDAPSSQRNPSNRASLLKPEGFRFLRDVLGD